MKRSPRQSLSVGAIAGATLALALSADAFGCSRDHGILASTSSSGSSGGGKVTSSASSSTGNGGGGGGGAGGNNTGGEPPGPPRLTVLDAIVDEDAVRLCFVPYPDGDPTAEPWPGAAGLAFGDARIIDGSSGVIPNSTDVLAIVIGGDLSQTAGKTCDEIVAEAGTGGSGGGGGAGSSGSGGAGGGKPGPPFVAVSLGVLPASAFAAKRSLLLATAGCLGGAGHDDPNAALVCGNGYTSTTPTAQLAALALSRRVSPGHVALQLVQASVATPDLMVDIAPSKTANEVVIAPSLTYGAAEPAAPYAAFSAGDLFPDGRIVAYSLNGGPPLATTSLGDARQHGDGGTLLDDHAFAFVAIGASPAVGAGPWWHAFTWTAVRSDP